MQWQELTPSQRNWFIAGAVVLLIVLIAGAFALGRGTADETADVAEPTATIEPTDSDGTPDTQDGDDENGGAEPGQAPEREPTPEPVPDTPAPAAPPAAQGNRAFGQLKGIRDESGGMWSDLWIDIDTADFLTGDAALSWLTSLGDAEFYSPAYWYARNDAASITSYRLVSPGPPVWMYTYPTAPAPGFYGPGMSRQVLEFGVFYDRIYMYDDADALLGRFYWLTLDGDQVTLIEEQPRDPYYEP